MQRDSIVIKARHKLIIESYQKVMKSYGENSKYMPKYKIYNDVLVDTKFINTERTIRRVIKDFICGKYEGNNIGE